MLLGARGFPLSLYNRYPQLWLSMITTHGHRQTDKQTNSTCSGLHLNLLKQTRWEGGPGVYICETSQVTATHSPGWALARAVSDLGDLLHAWGSNCHLQAHDISKCTCQGMTLLFSAPRSVFPTAFRHLPLEEMLETFQTPLPSQAYVLTCSLSVHAMTNHAPGFHARHWHHLHFLFLTHSIHPTSHQALRDFSQIMPLRSNPSIWAQILIFFC